jgi:Domain of unknown function (DUF4249)
MLFLLCFDSCIERAEFPSGKGKPIDIVVDGVITDEPGPYTIKLSRPSPVGAILGGAPISNAKISLFSDTGESEMVRETSFLGTYQTSVGGIRGVIGRQYWISIQMPGGQVFESIPDKLNPPGRIDSLYHEFETIVADNGTKSYGFRVFVDAQFPEAEGSYTRWRFNGIYAVSTLPDLHAEKIDGNCEFVPRPCGGKVYDREKQKFVTLTPCTCCDCWVPQFEKKPILMDNKSANKVARLQVGFVPINFYTFQYKVQINVTQLTISKMAFDYWKTIKDQKEGATSLFQPSYNKTESNLFAQNEGVKVLGIFYAASVAKKKQFIKRETNNAYLLTEIPQVDCFARKGPAGESCLFMFPGSTNQKPIDWD